MRIKFQQKTFHEIDYTIFHIKQQRYKIHMGSGVIYGVILKLALVHFAIYQILYKGEGKITMLGAD